MSRSNYSDDPDNLAMWRGQVASSIRGKRGQRLLHQMAAALDAMPVKELIGYALVDDDGSHCALGVVGAQRGLDLKALDPEEPDQIAKAFDISHQLASEIAYINDEAGPLDGDETPGQRWTRVRAWVEKQISPTPRGTKA